jgi:hypothetical protein
MGFRARSDAISYPGTSVRVSTRCVPEPWQPPLHPSSRRIWWGDGGDLGTVRDNRAECSSRQLRPSEAARYFGARLHKSFEFRLAVSKLTQRSRRPFRALGSDGGSNPPSSAFCPSHAGTGRSGPKHRYPLETAQDRQKSERTATRTATRRHQLISAVPGMLFFRYDANTCSTSARMVSTRPR